MVGCQEATSVLWGWKKDWKWAFFKCCKSRGRWEEDRLFALIGGSSPSLSRGIDSLYCFICEKPGRFFFSCPTKCARAACKLASSVESKVTRLTVACPTSYRQMWQSKKRKQSSVSRWIGWWLIWFFHGPGNENMITLTCLLTAVCRPPVSAMIGVWNCDG